MGLKIQQFQSDQEEVQQSRSGDDDDDDDDDNTIISAVSLIAYDVFSVPASRKHSDTPYFSMKNRYSRQYC